MNLDNDEWLIEDGVLKVYRSDSPIVHIPKGVRVIDNRVFARNNFIKRFKHNEILKVELPNTLQEIGRQAFYNCDFDAIYIPDSVTTIKSEAFAGCNKLRSFKVSNANIDADVFDGEKAFNMTITPNVKFLGINYGVKYISIDCSNSNVDEINNLLYNININCPSIKHISLDNVNYHDIGDIHFEYIININTLVIIKDPTTNTSIKVEKGKLIEYRSDIKEVVLPEGILIIAKNLFYNCQLKSIKLPNSLKKIEEYAFSLNNLKYIEIPENVEDVDNCFSSQYGNNNLTVKILSQNCSINRGAFYSDDVEALYFHINTDFKIGYIYSKEPFMNCTYHIDCSGASRIEIQNKLKQLEERLQTGKKIILYNSNLPKMDIDIMTFLSLNVELLDNPNILKSAYENTSKNKEKKVVQIARENIEKDKDILEKINRIEDLIKDIKDEDKVIFKNKVEQMLEEFRTLQDNLEPTIDFARDAKIKLEFTDDILYSKPILLAKLDAIINIILLNNNDLEFIKKINTYKDLLNDKSHLYKPTNTDTIEDKIRYIKYTISSLAINDDLKNEILVDLENILDETYTVISKRMGTKIDDRLDITNFTDYEQQLSDKIEKVFQRVIYIDWLIATFLGNLDTELAEIFSDLNGIIDELDEENKNEFNSLIEDLLVKYLKVQDFDKEKKSLEISEDLNTILFKLQSIAPLIGKHNIIDSLRNSKKIINGEVVYYNKEGFIGSIEELVEEIYEQVKLVSDSEIEKTVDKMREVINGYLKKLLNNEQVINKDIQFKFNFSEEQTLYFMILSDLIGIKMSVNKYFADKVIYERRKVNI